MEELSEVIRPRVISLRDLQKDHDTLQKEFQEELLRLEVKYESKYQPLYEKRSSIVRGPSGCGSEEDGVPGFWLKALKHNYILSDMITEADEGALASLIDVRCQRLPDGHSFRLEFEFAKNEYFSDTVLSKTLYFRTNHEDDSVNVDLDRSEGCAIHWHPSRNLTVRVVKKTQRHKTKNVIRTVEKEEATESFFSFFSTTELPQQHPSSSSAREEGKGEDHDSNDNGDEELLDAYHQSMSIDFEIADIIRNKVVPDAVNWFLGLAEDDSAPFDDEDEDGCCDHSGDDDEDDDEEPHAHQQARHHRAERKAPGGNPECKQQ